MDTKACYERKPVAGTYTTQGTFEDIDGFKTYITGPATATQGVVLIYDIFGLANQTLQGADLLSSHLAATVVVPDVFQGKALSVGDSSITAEDRKVFLSTTADIPNGLQSVLGFRKTIGSRFPSVQGWGIFGLCWGGKVAVLSTASTNNADPNTGFKVSGQAHGARVDHQDAENLNVPHINLASHDEPADQVKGYAEVFGSKGNGVVETYDKMFHGWMGARANLEDEENLKEYQRGYEQTADFFAKYL